MFITVFTPTYNRRYTLSRLFDSLQQQTIHDFEWLIIDDGSEDNTTDLVNKHFVPNAKFNIKYIYKENEGKNSAINEAASLAKGMYLFIVDSDDYLTADAIEIITKYCLDINDRSEYAGVAGLRADQKGRIYMSFGNANSRRKARDIVLNREYIDANAIEYRYRLGIVGDRAEVIKRDILLKYPFPKFQNETFMPECYLWYSIARDGYIFRWFNKVIYYTEYLNDGLTKNMKSIGKKNCQSFAYLNNFMTSLKGIRVKSKVHSAMDYYYYSLLGGKFSVAELYKKCRNKFYGMVALPYGIYVKLVKPINAKKF